MPRRLWNHRGCERVNRGSKIVRILTELSVCEFPPQRHLFARDVASSRGPTMSVNAPEGSGIDVLAFLPLQ
jgi:hypothetical protein